MASSDNNLYFFGEDFDIIMDILDEDDELEEQFVAAVDEACFPTFFV